MDLERIKQNFRMRSGRKKSTKKTKTSTPSFANQNTQTDPIRPATAGAPNGHASTPPTDTIRSQSTEPALEEVQQEHIKTLQALGPDTVHTKPSTEEASTSSHSPNDNGVDASDSPVQEEVKPSMPEGETRDEQTYQEETPPTVAEMADPYSLDRGFDSEAEDFDLRPPASRPKPPSMEDVSELLFSAGHLHALVYDPELLIRFTIFLQKYRPDDIPLLKRYLETAKAIKAIEYANAVAESAADLPQQIDGNDVETSNIAAVIDASFRESCSAAFDTLVNTTLPLYITYTIIRTITECLIDEITGRATPVMQDLVGGLSEVFCLSDPNQPDNPIIYASEEFYRLTGYSQEHTIGSNCRFLQGAKTNRESPKRIRESLERGEEIYETLLNYKRDGRPFINVLMIAPLHDDQGNVKYYLGAQVDVSRLIESGRVLEGFQRYLVKRQTEMKRDARETAKTKDADGLKRKNVLDKLRELSELFDLEESAVVQSNSRASSLSRDSDSRSMSSGMSRRRFIDSEASDDDDDDDVESTAEHNAWNLAPVGASGLSGKLPGIYEKYMLIRPAPSLRIVFISPKLRKFGRVVQSPFMSHVAAPAGTLAGLVESFEEGIPVSARINFMPHRSDQRHGTTVPPNERHEDGKYGRACWMSATPLLGGDDRVGVWMIIFIEKAQAKSRRTRMRTRRPGAGSLQNQRAQPPRRVERLDGMDGYMEDRRPEAVSLQNQQVDKLRRTERMDSSRKQKTSVTTSSQSQSSHQPRQADQMGGKHNLRDGRRLDHVRLQSQGSEEAEPASQEGINSSFTRKEPAEVGGSQTERADESKKIGAGDNFSESILPPGTNHKKGGYRSDDVPIKPKRLDDPIHYVAQRQGSQRSVAAYQYQAVSPVDEYHSAGEEGKSTSPVVPAPRADMPHQTPIHELTEDEEFVEPVPDNVFPSSPERTRIRPDSDMYHSVAEEWPSETRFDFVSSTEQTEEVQDPNEIAPSIPSDHEPLQGEDEYELEEKAEKREERVKSPHENEYELGEKGRREEEGHKIFVEQQAPMRELQEEREKSEEDHERKQEDFVIEYQKDDWEEEAEEERVGSPHTSTTPPRSLSSENDGSYGIASVETLRQPRRLSSTPPPKSPSADSDEPPSGITPIINKTYKSRAGRSSGTLPAGISYMDYLRHPGSSRQASGDVDRGRRRSRRGSEDSTDCARSPYSVD